MEEGEKCGCEKDREYDDDSDGDDHDDDGQDSDEEYDEELGDPWIRDIDSCTEQETPTHAHVRIGDEKSNKRLFF